MDNRSNATLESIQKTSKSESFDVLVESERKEVTHRKNARKYRLLHTGLPLRHITTEPKMDNEWGKHLIKIQKELGTGVLYAIIGKRGTGKTQIATALIEMVYNDKMGAKYCIAMDFSIAIKATYQRRAEQTEDEVIRTFVAPHLLVVDEIHERGETNWENRLLTYMIDKRYSAMKDTVLISNQTLEVFQKAIGSSILSRLQETGAVILCDWPSFRETDGGKI